MSADMCVNHLRGNKYLSTYCPLSQNLSVASGSKWAFVIRANASPCGISASTTVSCYCRSRPGSRFLPSVSRMAHLSLGASPRAQPLCRGKRTNNGCTLRNEPSQASPRLASSDWVDAALEDSQLTEPVLRQVERQGRPVKRASTKRACLQTRGRKTEDDNG